MHQLANMLTLHFIVNAPKPEGLNDHIYNLCKAAFDSNRGKFEKERDAVLSVLEGQIGGLN